MAPVLSGHKALRNLFAALTEQTFQVELGVADTAMTDYLADLLVRFIRSEELFRVRNTQGKRLEEVAEMLIEAEERQAKPKREIHRHIGDFTLFWSGVFPEALEKRKAPGQLDHLVDYRAQGKRSYMIASTFVEDPYHEEAPVLARLSEEFEMCTYGLGRVREEWESLPATTRDSAKDESQTGE